MWGRKQVRATDVDEARKLRARATAELEVLHQQAPYVQGLVATLIERREQNHFGDELQITYTPRRRDV